MIRWRLLDAERDRDLLVVAYRWRDDHPQWFRECLDVWPETLEEYLENAKEELRYGVFVDGHFCAEIRLIGDRPGVFNIHLSAEKGVEFADLLAAGVSLRDALLDRGVVGFFGYLPTVNKGVSRLYEALGFADTGIRIYKGQLRRKTIEWVHYSLTSLSQD